MQIASKQCFWESRGTGTVVEVEMTPATGLRIQFLFWGVIGEEALVDWGDGSTSGFVGQQDQVILSHTYSSYGRYDIRGKNLRGVGLRRIDGEPQYSYDAAILSVVDYGGTVTGSASAAFKRCVNLKRVILPNCTALGQRDFAECTSLVEARFGRVGTYFDGTFRSCTSLVDFTVERSWTCWQYVWKGCSALMELRLGDVNQLSTEDFKDTPNLKDIWIANKTVDQIRQVAASGNIVGGFSSKFPWGASADCRFHGTDGIVLGNGTVIRE